MSSGEPAEQAAASPSPGRARSWIRRISARSGREHESPDAASARACERDDPLDVRVRIRALPTLLDADRLPNGIVELLVEDFEAPTRQLFDVHDGRITVIEPGSAVPWASIAGSLAAWASALGPERELDGLRLTGDQALARRVLAALPSGPA